MTTFNEHTFTLTLPVTLRLAREEDLPLLEWHGQYTQFRAIFRRTYREQLLGRRLMILAAVQNIPIGQIFVQLRSREQRMASKGKRAYLYALRVMDMFRSMGIGGRLIDEAEGIVTALGYEWTTIAVAKDNTRAFQLYNRKGYQIFDESDGDWSYTDHKGRVQSVHEPCWLLEKQLFRR
ncbi:MAG: GNAT family N-acetyltransferase [Anaerolineae bacterium]|nr:GNAT family N-acetyltransferase [Anaerolineae bacterium]